MPNPFTVTDTGYLLQERVKQLYVWVIKLVTREEITHLNLDNNIITGCLITLWSKVNASWGRRIYNFLELWCLVGSGGLDIWDSSTSFQKSNIDWPQQPPTESVSDISNKLVFWWSIPQKGTDFDHLGARDDPTIRISKFFDEMRLSRSLRPLRLLRL